MASTASQALIGMSSASQALDLGTATETDEERRKRLAAIAQSQQRLGAAASIGMSPAGSALGLT